MVSVSRSEPDGRENGLFELGKWPGLLRPSLRLQVPCAQVSKWEWSLLRSRFRCEYIDLRSATSWRGIAHRLHHQLPKITGRIGDQHTTFIRLLLLSPILLPPLAQELSYSDQQYTLAQRDHSLTFQADGYSVRKIEAVTCVKESCPVLQR